MSLFPAYTASLGQETPSNCADQQLPGTSSAAKEDRVSSYNSFELPPVSIINKLTDEIIGSTDDDEIIESDKIRLKDKQTKRKKDKKNLSANDRLPAIEFCGDEDYYVDKKPIKGYLSVETLHKPACPKYSRKYKVLGLWHFSAHKKSNRPKRYYKSIMKDSKSLDTACNNNILDEQVYMQKSTDFNRGISNNPKDMTNWIGLVELQSQAPYKWTKTTLTEKKIEIIERALVHNLGEEKLYNLYIDIINSIYPSFEVSKILDRLIAKDANNYTLWMAQILTTQCSMARCIVPDVLKLYQKCMQKMYQKSQNDDIMLRLFTNCALFLRQSGLNEQLFALIKLALELNVSTNKFDHIQPEEKDQHILIEYEEIILKSGLPMNEIWLRIEKLRQSFNYLPCPTSFKCTDPQRVVFNEDICYFVYPLTVRENSFYLILTILRLLKLPLFATSSLQRRFSFKKSDFNDTDAIEDILPVFLYEHYFRNTIFYNCLYDYLKEMVVSPSYLNTLVGYELYLKTIVQILFTCADCYTNVDEQKRTIFILLWLRFERILLCLEKLSGKFTLEYAKKLRSRIKKLLKQDLNRNVINFYTEFALIEFELADKEDAFEAIFSATLCDQTSDSRNSDISNAYATYTELLIKLGKLEKALKVVISYALKININDLNEENILTDSKKLATIQYLSEKVSNLIQIEKNVEIMELEQYFIPDYLINLIKLKIYCQCLLGHKLEAIGSLEIILKQFLEKNDRHFFIREHIYEIYINIIQWEDKNCIVSNVLLYDKISDALNVYPENLFFLNSGSVLHNQPWYKIRSLLTKSNSIISIIFLITAASYRSARTASITTSIPYNFENYDLVAKMRIDNLIRCLLYEGNGHLRKNALLWRLYLRCLSTNHVSFETTKNCLLTALDECPWNKALYLDGSIFVPQELSQLQDLVIEKQLRIYALPEELEILRNDDMVTV